VAALLKQGSPVETVPRLDLGTGAHEAAIDLNDASTPRFAAADTRKNHGSALGFRRAACAVFSPHSAAAKRAKRFCAFTHT
jgi:hypothetical protein